MDKRIAIIVLCGAGLFWPREVFSQGTNPKLPIPRPVPKEAPLVDAWYFDPRWWGIGATGMLSVSGLILQWSYRRSDRKNEVAADHFDSDIRDPIKSTYIDLRGLATAAALACEVDDLAARIEAIKQVRYEAACKALSVFSMVLNEADSRLKLKGEFSDINADLEDDLYIAVGAMAKCDDPVERRALSKKIKVAVTAAIVSSDKLLGEQRKKYIREWR